MKHFLIKIPFTFGVNTTSKIYLLNLTCIFRVISLKNIAKYVSLDWLMKICKIKS